MNLKILNSRERKKIRKMLTEQFGCEVDKGEIFLLNENKKRVYIFSGGDDYSLEDLRIDSIGCYFGTIMGDKIRLSIEGSQIIGPLANRNILFLNKEDTRKWMAGENIAVNDPEKKNRFVIVAFQNGAYNDYMGCGRVIDGVLSNYIPKARRARIIE